MPNSRPNKCSEFFHLQSPLNSEFFRLGVRVPTFFGHAKFEAKNVFGIFSFTGHLRPKNSLEFFHLQSTLNSEFFRGGVWGQIFFDHTTYEVKDFSEFFHLQNTMDCELNFLQGSLGTNFFWST